MIITISYSVLLTEYCYYYSYYHAHMDAVQTAKGIKGAFVVLKRPDVDPVQLNPLTTYDEDLTVVVSDEWREPDVSTKSLGV